MACGLVETLLCGVFEQVSLSKGDKGKIARYFESTLRRRINVPAIPDILMLGMEDQSVSCMSPLGRVLYIALNVTTHT